jgi:hypothetical protein
MLASVLIKHTTPGLGCSDHSCGFGMMIVVPEGDFDVLRAFRIGLAALGYLAAKCAG